MLRVCPVLRYLGVDEWSVSDECNVWEFTTKVRLNGREGKAFNIKVEFGSRFTAVHHPVRRLSKEFKEGLPNAYALCRFILFDGRNRGIVTGKVDEVEEMGWKWEVFKWILVRQGSCDVRWTRFGVSNEHSGIIHDSMHWLQEELVPIQSSA